ncbi:Beta-barrel assembly machine subunit BamD [Lishizhenia tianjinensis]|uniref:Beta-barrel assembly machine subunit BamD n=1 Tax=Lishizhenia tianjinensis TaxID=477690 RepID=A0A1I6Z1S5_9FLAO|nr:outer membrane protein assembly factor BamD [Lishizhenia tianjinensis]SFT56653.1 Beta-barrel assembly machine subunit BamD [Lishizhenia tianjinensis]
MKNKILSTTTVLMLSLVMLSCSDYGQVVKGDNYEDKLLKAEALYAKESYPRAITLYEQVYQRYPRTEDGQLSYYKMGMSYYKMRDFIMAGYYLNNFVSRFPYSAKAEECLFLSAMCSVKLSPDASLDQEDTQIAINDLQTFIDRYPESNLVDSCNAIMDNLRFKLETKEYNSVMLYHNMENYKAAKTSATLFMENFPQSSYNEELAYIRVYNAFTLATKSIFTKKKERFEEVIKYCDLFTAKYETSSFGKKVRKIKENSQEELLKVSENYKFRELLASYQLSETESKAKKIIYLKETIEKHRNFVAEFPNSEFLKRANDIKEKAEKELQKLQ